MSQKIKVSLIKSKYGRLGSHRLTLEGLGLRKIRQSVILNDTPEIRGMIKKIDYMLHVEAV